MFYLVGHPEVIQMGLSGSVPESRLGSGQLSRLPVIQAESPKLGVSAQAVDRGDENTASFLYFLPKGRASKKSSLRAIRPSLNVISTAVRVTPMGSANSIS